jgi:hypothetical protein
MFDELRVLILNEGTHLLQDIPDDFVPIFSSVAFYAATHWNNGNHHRRFKIVGKVLL